MKESTTQKLINRLVELFDLETMQSAQSPQSASATESIPTQTIAQVKVKVPTLEASIPDEIMSNTENTGRAVVNKDGETDSTPEAEQPNADANAELTSAVKDLQERVMKIEAQLGEAMTKITDAQTAQNKIASIQTELKSIVEEMAAVPSSVPPVGSRTKSNFTASTLEKREMEKLSIQEQITKSIQD